MPLLEKRIHGKEKWREKCSLVYKTMAYSLVYKLVSRKSTDVSEENVAFIFRVEE
jgi:hypothetical protein